MSNYERSCLAGMSIWLGITLIAEVSNFEIGLVLGGLAGISFVFSGTVLFFQKQKDTTHD